jgi:hypothetical protein
LAFGLWPLYFGAGSADYRLQLLPPASCSCLLPPATRPYKLFMNCLPHPYANGRKPIDCMRKLINTKRIRTYEAIGGVCCFVGGILAALVGSLMTLGELIVGTKLHPVVHLVGTTFLVAAIPLIIVAGFCLDWSERHP